MEFANVFTSWATKDRAGVVGSGGVYDLVRALQAPRARGIRVHLSQPQLRREAPRAPRLRATAAGRPTPSTPSSIFQGAFSHFAFSTADEIRRLGITTDRDGLYVDVVAQRRVAGPLVATYSRQDQANQMWYPRGVLISGDFTEVVGVPRYGSVGGDGMQGPVVERTALVTDRLSGRVRPYGPRLFNVDATNVIRGHSDLISDRTVDLVWDVVQATRTTRP